MSVGAVSSSTTSSATSSTPASAGIGLTSNQFLSLLTTQLQSQNPLNPTDPNQFTSEMVQYAGLSEQIDTNAKLDAISTTMSNVLTQVSLLAQAGGASATQN
ncbi:MAG TPA: flagellar hook capping FlgD N-terminal domain-containing protein [Phenylobacterium sp.]|uniref:flagellar hook capping FlgD N-terminal domain-containing protein n=1 Tax=Phenylobacterium sp. TaxID=1871053 RepID=UPI002B49D992|nr:flagellar hook capping FlgD N-terminal domain-containing protein [Phenylobacterium sp.]HKR89884.1 flagellar hook capping FlgD N-terminal domain-containing protein [Phenylobacterium sp.]